MAENLELSLMVGWSGGPLSGELAYPELFPPDLMKPGPSVLLLPGMVRPEPGRLSVMAGLLAA